MFRSRRGRPRKPMDSGEAFALLMLGVLLGTVFTFGMRYWNRPIQRAEALMVEAVFSDYREEAGHGKSRLKLGKSAVVTGGGAAVPIVLEFADHEPLTIDGSCVTGALLTALQSLESGEKLSCLVHPNGGAVMEIAAQDGVLLAFDDAAARLTGEQRGFMILGLILYAAALYGLLNLLPRRK